MTGVIEPSPKVDPLPTEITSDDQLSDPGISRYLGSDLWVSGGGQKTKHAGKAFNKSVWTVLKSSRQF